MEQEIIERILERFAGGDYVDEVKSARDSFFGQLKDLREDDPSFERLTGCFLNWYVFDRPMDSGLGTPAQVFAASDEISSEDHEMLAAMVGNIHALFEVLRIDEGFTQLKDLFTTEILKVTERRSLAGLDPGDILEARLLPLGGKLVFSTGAYLLHPRPARGLIIAAIDKCRRAGQPSSQQMISKLQALSFRFSDRFQQRVPVDKVYGELETFTG